MKGTRLLFILLLTGSFLRAGGDPAIPPPLEREVYLMGTVAHLQMYASRSKRTEADLEALIRLLHEVESRLSTWRSDSTLSRLNEAPLLAKISLDPLTCRLLPELRGWVEETGGAFDPAIGSLLRAWDLRGVGRIPSEAEIEEARRVSGIHHIVLEEQICRVARAEEVLFDAGAFGKGAALDELRAYSRRHALDPWRISLGGQVAFYGESPHVGGWKVAIAGPEDRQAPSFTLHLEEGSVAVSGNSERAKRVAGRKIGHLMDPRNGRPAPFQGSVAVWHKDALVADLLSTALFVMGPDRGLVWAEKRGVAAAYLYPQSSGSRLIESTSAFSDFY